MSNDNPNEEVTVLCPATNKALFTMTNGKMKYLAEHGPCSKCNTECHIEHLRTSDGMTRCSWPVRYIGYTCATCWPKK